MDFTIDEDRKNELLKRRELAFTVNFEGPTPSRQQVADKLAAVLALDQNLLVIDSLRTRFGKTELKGKARVYESEEQKTVLERPYLLARGKKEAKAEEKA